MVIMGFTVEDSNCQHSTMEKQIASLRKSVQQTKCAIAGKLKKSEHRFNEEINNSEGEKKISLLKKLDKISKQLQILDDLPEDDIVKFALTTHRNMMAVASNRRLPETLRMKARVASHKPLSVRLARIKSKLKEKKESEVEGKTELSARIFNKMSVNNQIVKMRKTVKQSKVHVIHKLTRNIKILRKAKGRNKEKSEKKADRLVKKLNCIKELHEDDISRLALTSTQDLTKLSIDINAPLKSQVMATIATHKFVADSVKEFKNTHPDLHKNILTVLKKNKNKRKLITEGIESDRQNGIRQNKKLNDNTIYSDSEKSISGNEESRGEESGEEVSGEEERGEEKSERERCHNKKESVQSKEESEHSEIEDARNKTFEKSDIEKYSGNVISESHKMASMKIKIKNSVTKLAHKKDIKLTEPSIKNNSDIETGIIDSSSTKCSTLKKTDKIKPITPKVVDPFFVTSTNEEYVTSQVPSFAESDDTNCTVRNKNFDLRGSYKINKNNKNWGSKQDFREQSIFGRHDYKKPLFNFTDVGPKFNKSLTNFTLGNRKERRKALHQPVEEEKIEKLHPSWEAKKKLSTIANFQGKKITFD